MMSKNEDLPNYLVLGFVRVSNWLIICHNLFSFNIQILLKNLKLFNLTNSLNKLEKDTLDY